MGQYTLPLPSGLIYQEWKFGYRSNSGLPSDVFSSKKFEVAQRDISIIDRTATSSLLSRDKDQSALLNTLHYSSFLILYEIKLHQSIFEASSEYPSEVELFAYSGNINMNGFLVEPYPLALLSRLATKPIKENEPIDFQFHYSTQSAKQDLPNALEEQDFTSKHYIFVLPIGRTDQDIPIYFEIKYLPRNDSLKKMYATVTPANGIMLDVSMQHDMQIQIKSTYKLCMCFHMYCNKKALSLEHTLAPNYFYPGDRSLANLLRSNDIFES